MALKRRKTLFDQSELAGKFRIANPHDIVREAECLMVDIENDGSILRVTPIKLNDYPVTIDDGRTYVTYITVHNGVQCRVHELEFLGGGLTEFDATFYVFPIE